MMNESLTGAEASSAMPADLSIFPNDGDPARSPRLRVLVVEDSEDDAMLVTRELQCGGYEPVWRRVDTREAMKAALAEQSWGVVISDHSMPQFSAPAALALLQTKGIDVPFIIVSGAIIEEFAVAGMRAGADDYLRKGSLARLVPAVERGLREAQVRQERQRAHQAQQEEAEISAALARAGQELIAALDTPALLGRLCQVTAEVLRCDYSHTILLDREAQVFIPVAGYGDMPEHWESICTLRIPRSFIAEVVARTERDGLTQVTVAESQDPLPPALAFGSGLSVSLFMALRRGGNRGE